MPESNKEGSQNEELKKEVEEERITEEPIKETKGGETSMGLDENVAGALCYAFGWITGLIFLVTEKKNSFVRFHAMQSIVVFLVLQVLGFIPLLNLIVFPLILILWIFLMFKAYKGERFKLPVIGDFAEEQAKNL